MTHEFLSDLLFLFRRMAAPVPGEGDAADGAAAASVSLMGQSALAYWHDDVFAQDTVGAGTTAYA